MVQETMITKMEAAETQLETAIKLFFENRDHLSCLTLVSASREITDDLCEKQKDKIYNAELERLGDPQKVRLSFREELKIFISPSIGRRPRPYSENRKIS